MADISNLSKFLGDVADAIRTKKGTTESIAAANFDTEISEITTGVMTQGEYDLALDTTTIILTGITEKYTYVQDGLVSQFDLNEDFSDKQGLVTVTNDGVSLVYNSDLARNVAQKTRDNARIGFTSPGINLTSFTLSIRAKSDGSNTGEHNMMLGVYASSSGQSFGLKAHYSKYSIERNFSQIDSPYDVNTDTNWHRYTALVENGTTLKMYVDEELVYENTGSYSVADGEWSIGNYKSGWAMPWNGQYYGALIYNRALTDEEIRHNVSVDMNGG